MGHYLKLLVKRDSWLFRERMFLLDGPYRLEFVHFTYKLEDRLLLFHMLYLNIVLM